MTRALLFAAMLCSCLPVKSNADSAEASARRAGIGIWKAAVPKVDMHGEFGGHDPIGLANRQFIKADCSLNWTDPDDGKLYCFASATSLGYFQDWPKRHGRRARAFWETHKLTQ